LGSRSSRQALQDFQSTRSQAFWSIPQPPRPDAPALIGHDVWIGEDVLLGRNISIGTGAVIGARSVVTKDVPPYAIVAGTPARLVRMRFEPALVQRLLSSRWWRYHFAEFARWDYDQPERFLDQLEAAQASGGIEPFETSETPFVERLAGHLQTAGHALPTGLAQGLDRAREQAQLDARFPVPADCSYWHAAETDRRDGMVMRFFARQAWCDVVVKPSDLAVTLTVHHEVLPEASRELTVRWKGFDLLRSDQVTHDAIGRKQLRFQLPVAALPRSSTVGRLELHCQSVAVPALLNSTSRDQRQLSLALSRPRAGA
jgi:hypothetical protein